MKKPVLIVFLTTITVCGLISLSIINLSTVKASKEVNGIISSDTTWTKANSPYTLTGPVAVNIGVTLTIDAGTTVNLNGYYIQVNGTLSAVGNSADKIHLSDGTITFSQSSSSWNEQTGSGSIIENAILTSDQMTIEIWNVSPKINRNSIVGSIFLNEATPYSPGTEAAPTISNNIISKNSYSTAIQSSISPSITNNTIKGGIVTGGHGSTVISNNIIEGDGEYGVLAGSVPDHISDNIISGFNIGIRASVSTVIERNLIANNHDGILMGINANPIIRNNTITNNTNGISLPGYSTGGLMPGGPPVNYYNIQINYNNIYDNSEYSIRLYMDGAYPKDDVNATYNWWGTTDTQAISQKIHDNKNDFNLGTVTFEPFLTEPNPVATPSATPEIPEFPTSIILALLATATLAMAVTMKKKE